MDRFSSGSTHSCRGLPTREPGSLLQPAVVTDRSGRQARAFGRAESEPGLVLAQPVRLASHDDPRRDIARAAAANHLACGLPHVAGDYMGEHWLASFALLALDAAGAAPP